MDTITAIEIATIVVGTLLAVFLGITLWRTIYNRYIRRSFIIENRQGNIEEIVERTIKRGMDRSNIYTRDQLRSLEEKLEVAENVGPRGGGYIILDMPEDKRSLFHDLLKGFEGYAKLKGYNVLFSVDSSVPDKIAFKFTLVDGVINVTPERVKQDLQDFMQKVESGEPLDNIPVVLSKEEHALVLVTLKNRINFLQMNYNIQQTTIAYYENLIMGANLTRGFLSASNIYVQPGGRVDSSYVSAIDSSNVMLGSGNVQTDSSIRIADSFIEKEAQIDNIIELIELLKSSEQQNEIAKEEAIQNLEKIKEELAEEGQPNGNRIEKWVRKACACLSNLQLTASIMTKAGEVINSFNLPDLMQLIDKGGG